MGGGGCTPLNEIQEGGGRDAKGGANFRGQIPTLRLLPAELSCK